MPSPTTVALHAGSDPAGVHPRVVLAALLLAVGTAVALYLLVGYLGPENRRDRPEGIGPRGE